MRLTIRGRRLRRHDSGGAEAITANDDASFEPGLIDRVAIEPVAVEPVDVEPVAVERVSIADVAIVAVPEADAARRMGRRDDDRVWLIRALSAAARWVVLLLVACVTAPIVLAFLRVQGLIGSAPRFTAFGDSAYLALRSRDVFAGPIPLVGSQSSAETAVNILQPGPAQFFAQAPWIGWLGGDLGSLLFAAVASGVAAVGAVWVTLRRFGVVGAAVAALIVVAIEAQLGAGALVDTISSTHGQLLAFFAVLISALVASGDLRLFPLAVGVSSYVLQVHLSLVGYGLLVIPLLVGALIVGLRRARSNGGNWFAPWALAGVVVGIVMWAPPLIDQFFDTGNLAAVFGAGGGAGAADGVMRTADELTSGLASVFGPIPALLAPTDRLLGTWYFERSDAQTNAGLAFGAVAAIGGLSALVIGLRRSRRLRRGLKLPDGTDRTSALASSGRQISGATVLLCGVALALIGTLFASRLSGYAIIKPNNNRWIVIAGAVTWLGVLLAVGSSRWVAGGIGRAARVRSVRWGAAAVAAVALVACSVFVGVRPLEPTVADPWLGGSRALAPAVSNAWGDRGPVRFRAVGPISAGGLQPALMLALEERGADTLTVGGVEALRAGYGEHRLAVGDDPPYILVQDGDIATPMFGELIGVIVARSADSDRSARSGRIEACLAGAGRAGAAVVLTAEGRRVADSAELAGDDTKSQLLAAGLGDPQLLFLTGLSREAVTRGYIEPVEVDGCSADDLDELAGELLLSAWLVP